MNKIYGIVILYNPDISIIENIKSYIEPLELLYIMDNSEQQNINIVNEVKRIEKTEYVFMGKNTGIGYPINKILSELDKDSWLLTMDQDSKFYKESFKDFIKIIQDVDSNAYAITPLICNEYNYIKQINKKYIIKKNKCIQSGSLFNVNIAKNIGGFNEEMFIDAVDTEYCFRCNRQKYILLMNSAGVLIHKLGKEIKKPFFPKIGIRITEHSPLRKYYIFRNNLYLKDEYPNEKMWIYMYLVGGILKLICLDSDKMEKIMNIKMAYKDYKNKIHGRKDI